MLQPINKGMHAFEVRLYNREVRAAVKDNESHFLFGDQWADCQVQDVAARSENEARALISRRYPPEQGFVVQELTILSH